MVETTALPDGWKWATLSTVANINGRDSDLHNLPDDIPVTFVPMAAVDAQRGIILNPQERQLSEVRKGFTSFSEGDVIFAKITPCMENGKVAIAENLLNRKGFGSTEFHVLRPGPNISSKWLFYFIRQEKFRADAKSSFTGTAGQLRVPANFLKDYPIPLPPLDEQERIIVKIEELFTQLDASTEALRRIQAGLKRYKASVLKAAVEGRLVPQDPSDEPAEAIISRQGKVFTYEGDKRAQPPGWCWAKVGDIGEHRLGKMLDKEKNKGDLHSYIRNINVRWFSFDLSDTLLIRVQSNELENVSIKKNDLVICEGGEPGRAAVWSKEESFVIQKALHRLRPTHGVLPHYINLCLASDANTGHLEKYFTGSTIKHFTGEALHSYLIPLPPTNEQRRIVAEAERQLSTISQLESAVDTILVRSLRLREAILKRAFTGKLLTKQSDEDSTGEVASISGQVHSQVVDGTAAQLPLF